MPRARFLASLGPLRSSAARYPAQVSTVGTDRVTLWRSGRTRGSNERETHLSVRDAPRHQVPGADAVDVPALVAACTDQWYNQTLCQVNDSVVRLGVMQGEYHWHKHDNDDEFFFVLEGHFVIDLEDRIAWICSRRKGFVVPKGVMHRTRAPERAVILMVETAAIVPTGDA